MVEVVSPIPAAQYLRMSTEHQQYSIENQSVAIQRYATVHGFYIVKSYTDAGKSGLVLNQREGLRQLLHDVLGGGMTFKAILVFDVSRWGRFQDCDEAAHYEFLCRSGGIPVHYCAESFTNDGSFPSMIMKALKRMMASEYSRELSEKVYAGASRLAQLGFRQGGIPGYGYRRMLVSPDRAPKQILLPGQRKSIQEDRVILVPGPRQEVSCVQEIFQMFVEEGKTPKAIAAELNARGLKYNGVLRNKWYAQAINRILRHRRYTGCCLYGQRSQKLHTPSISVPPKLWIVKTDAWQPLIDRATFDRAQDRFRAQTRYRSGDELLAALQKLWSSSGTVSERLVNQAADLPSLTAFVRRFGSLTEALARIGFQSTRGNGVFARRRTLSLRQDLIAKIISAATDRVTVVRRDGHFRQRLRLRDRSLVSVELLRSFRTKKGELRWAFNTHHSERDFVTLIARLNEQNDGFHDFSLFLI